MSINQGISAHTDDIDTWSGGTAIRMKIQPLEPSDAGTRSASRLHASQLSVSICRLHMQFAKKKGRQNATPFCRVNESVGY